MNLICEPWIPVKRQDGTYEKVEPWRITDFTEGKSPIGAIASPRPDFDGALTQFLIGLLQTTCTPTESEWWDWREKPPSPQTLRERFARVEQAFVLASEKSPLFMQERFPDDSVGNRHPISYLLIGSPKENALKRNTDHFQKRLSERDECLCASCSATALYTLQSFAPSGGGGGDGKFTSLRGGGPLTTIVLGNTLWETVWLNVIVGKTFAVQQPSEKIFPWLNIGAFFSGDTTVRTIHSVDMDAAHVFWGMPRRIQLEFSANRENKPCYVCGSVMDMGCHSFRDKTGGLWYQRQIGSTKKPSWVFPRHPLSPYTERNNDPPSAVHPQPGGIGYRHWLGLVENSTDGNFKRLPALAIEQFRSIAREDARLWAFGFDMGQDAARCWYDTRMPILHLEGEQAAILSAHLGNMVRAARYVSGLVMSAVLRATLLDAKKKVVDGSGGRFHIIWNWPKDVLAKLKRAPAESADAVKAKVNASGEDLEARVEKGLLSSPLATRTQFWASTELSFFQRAKELRDTLNAGGSEDSVLESWIKDMEEVACSVFRSHTQVGDFDVSDPRRMAYAQYELDQELKGSRLRNLLGLP